MGVDDSAWGSWEAQIKQVLVKYPNVQYVQSLMLKAIMVQSPLLISVTRDLDSGFIRNVTAVFPYM